MRHYDDTPPYAMVFPSVGLGHRSVKTPGGPAVEPAVEAIRRVITGQAGEPKGVLSNNRQILNTWILLTLFIVFARDPELSIIFE